MKNLFTKLLILITLFVGTSNLAKAQVICDPLVYPQCANCMIIDIVNDLPCPMTFHWEYSYNGCSQFAVAGSVGAGPGAITTLYGTCISFCDQPCQCPSWLRIGNWGGAPGFLSWVYDGAGASGTFVDCNGNTINYSVTPTGPNRATIHFW